MRECGPAPVAPKRAQMIAATSLSSQFVESSATVSLEPAGWRKSLANAVTTIDELCQLLDLDIRALNLGSAAIQQFPLKIPRSFVARIRRGDPLDPLLRQILPIVDE